MKVSRREERSHSALRIMAHGLYLAIRPVGCSSESGMGFASFTAGDMDPRSIQPKVVTVALCWKGSHLNGRRPEHYPAGDFRLPPVVMATSNAIGPFITIIRLSTRRMWTSSGTDRRWCCGEVMGP
jgi:hypothetical protein